MSAPTPCADCESSVDALLVAMERETYALSRVWDTHQLAPMLRLLERLRKELNR